MRGCGITQSETNPTMIKVESGPRAKAEQQAGPTFGPRPLVAGDDNWWGPKELALPP